MHPASTLYAVIRKLERRAQVDAAGNITWLDDLPPPSAQEWDAALAAVLARRTISAAQFGALFTDAEKHEVFRRASLSVNTSPLAPAFAKLHFRFAQLQTVESDSAELMQTLNLLQMSGVINQARRDQIAAFEPPTP